ncbi:MAG: hypothetical protein WHV44_08720, partial [Anaerolineales bacterium]
MKKYLLSFLIVTILLSACYLPQPTLQTTATAAAPTPVGDAAPATPLDFTLRAATIISPASGETYPLFTALPVLVSAISGEAEITTQELLVNGQVVETQQGEAIRPLMHWQANTPGRNMLQARIVTSDGQTLVSNLVEVNISSTPVGFDILKQTTGGETLAGLAGQFGLDAQTVADYNPGVVSGLNDPLPAGVLIRLPVAPVIPPGVLAQGAPGLATPSAPGAAASAG